MTFILAILILIQLSVIDIKEELTTKAAVGGISPCTTISRQLVAALTMC